MIFFCCGQYKYNTFEIAISYFTNLVCTSKFWKYKSLENFQLYTVTRYYAQKQIMLVLMLAACHLLAELAKIKYP